MMLFFTITGLDWWTGLLDSVIFSFSFLSSFLAHVHVLGNWFVAIATLKRAVKLDRISKPVTEQIITVSYSGN